MSRRAVAYASDVIFGRTGEVLSRAAQKEAIRRHAEENDIEIVEWVEDELYEEDLLNRPGIRRILELEESCDCVLVERFCCLTWSWKKLKQLIDRLGERGMALESAAWLWDCVSVVARHYCRRSACQARTSAEIAAREPAREEVASPPAPKRSIRRPERLHFAEILSTAERF